MPFFKERKNSREGRRRRNGRSSFVSKSRIEMIRKNQRRMKVKKRKKEKVVSCRMKCSVDLLLSFPFRTSARRSLPPSLPSFLVSVRPVQIDRFLVNNGGWSDIWKIERRLGRKGIEEKKKIKQNQTKHSSGTGCRTRKG